MSLAAQPPAPRETEPSLRACMKVQARVVGALLMREVITRFGRYNLGVLWLIGEPMIFTLGVATLWSFAGISHGHSVPVIAFAITGYSSVLLWRNTVSRSTSGIAQNFNLLYHRNVRLLDVFVARVVLEMAGVAASFTVLSLLFIGIEWMDPPVDLLKVIGGLLMLAWFGVSLSVLLGAATAFSEVVERIWHPMAYLLFPVGGAAFMVEWLPPAAQEVVLTLPMVHGVELLREGYFGGAVRAHYDLAYMAGVNLGLTFAGLVVAHYAAQRVEAQ